MPAVMLVLAVRVVNVPALAEIAPTTPVTFDAVRVVVVIVVIVAAGPLQAVLKLIVPVTAALPVTERPVPADVQVTVVNVPAAGTPPPMAGGLDR